MIQTVFGKDIGLSIRTFRFMDRLNSGIRNRHNFFVWALFSFSKVENDPVNNAESEDIKILI